MPLDNNTVFGWALFKGVQDRNDVFRDFMFCKVNAAWSKLIGKENPGGTTIRELFPNTESYWFDILNRVCKTSKAETHTAYHSETAKTWDCYAFMTDPAKDEVAMLFAEHINPDDPRKKANSDLFEMITDHPDDEFIIGLRDEISRQHE